MRDDQIHPVRPIHAIESVREVEIPRRPALGQLRTWLRFARRMADRRKVGQEQEAREMTPVPETHSEDKRGPGKWA